MRSKHGKMGVLVAAFFTLIMPAIVSGESGLTLKQVMNGLNKSLQDVTYGIIVEDYGLVESASITIADHPSPDPEILKKVVGRLGEEMPKFKSFDLQVHDAAVELMAAAKKRDKEEIIKLHGTILRGCVNCHEGYRKIVSELFK